MNPLSQQIKSGISWTTLATLLRMGTQFLLVVILSRVLSTQQIGIFSIILVAANISNIFSDLGISKAIIHFDLDTRQLNLMYFLNILVGALVSSLVFILAPMVGAFYQSSELSSLLKLFAPVFFLKSFGLLYPSLFQKYFEFKILAILESSVEVGQFLAIVGLLLLDFNLKAIPGGYLIGAILFSLLMIGFGLKIFKPGKNAASLAETRASVEFGLYQMGERSLNFISANMVKILLGKFYGLDLLGLFELAWQLLIRPLGLVSQITGRLSLPVYATLKALPQKANRVYVEHIRLFSFFTLLTYAFLMASADEISLLLYGADKAPQVSEIFRIIGWLGILWSVGNPIGGWLLGLGKANYGFLMNVVQFGTYLSLLLAGQWWFGELYRSLWLLIAGLFSILLPLDYWVRHRINKMPVLPHLLAWTFNLFLAMAFGLSIQLVDWCGLSSWQMVIGIKVLLGVVLGGALVLWKFPPYKKQLYKALDN